MAERERLQNWLDRINALSCAYVTHLNVEASPLVGVEIWFTGFKPCQGNIFILGQLVAYPEGIWTRKEGSKFKTIDEKMTLYHAHVPDRGMGKCTRGSELEAIAPPDVPHFTGHESAQELQEVLKNRFDALVAFIQANPAEWMTNQP